MKIFYSEELSLHQLLAYADDVNLLGDNIDTIKKNTEILIDASKEIDLEINVEKTITQQDAPNKIKIVKLSELMCITPLY
jgi:hypothetical protein